MIFHGPVALSGLLELPAASFSLRATIDFVNGTYEIDGTSYAASDIVDKTERIGASGLEILDDDADGTVDTLGDLLALLVTANWTAVIEYDEATTTYLTVPLSLSGSTSSDTAGVFRQAEGATPTLSMKAYATSNTSREAVVPQTFGVGTHKIAMTLTSDLLAVSVDGSAAVMDAASQTLDLDQASLGGDPGGGSYNGTTIRSIMIYTPASASSLPSLSA